MPSSTSSSKPQLARPFDDDVVQRPVPERPWRGLALAAVAATVVLTLGWELYWRAHYHIPGDFKNTAALWSQERRKVESHSTVLFGSSRIFFDVDLDVWEEASGVRPIQLALEGTSPEPFLAELADDENFKGLVIVGITAPIVFTGYAYRGEVLDYYRNESPSQRIDHMLSMQLEKMFAFIDEQTRPKRMWFLTGLPTRKGMEPRFDVRKLERHDADRNTEVWTRLMEEEPYRELAKSVWATINRVNAPPPGPNGEPPAPMPDEAINEVITQFKTSVDKIRARGGDVTFVRFPYEGDYTQVEDFGFPRQRFWDRLVSATDSASVSWHDYPELQGYYLPEWSHIAPRDAERYTRVLAPIFYEQLAKKKAERAARE